MSNKSLVYNRSKCTFETAKKEGCPRCHGDGQTLHDAQDSVDCSLCDGKGTVWISKSGWVRKLRGSKEESRLW